MKQAILFNYFVDVEVCLNRLKMLRKFNPGMPIYGLYGGPPEKGESFASQIESKMDDSYIFSEDRTDVWRWANPDLLIAGWYRDRGKDLEWDTLVWVHWDQLILAPINEIFPNYRQGELLLTGVRPIKEVESWWHWVSKENIHYGYDHYMKFFNFIKDHYNYKDEPLACQGLLTIFPREFLERYSYMPNIEYGNIEYKFPIYAQIFGTPFCQAHKIEAYWEKDPDEANATPRAKCMTASKQQVPLRTVLNFMKEKNSQRIFHPYRRIYPLDGGDWLRLLRDKLFNRRYSRKHIKLKK